MTDEEMIARAEALRARAHEIATAMVDAMPEQVEGAMFALVIAGLLGSAGAMAADHGGDAEAEIDRIAAFAKQQWRRRQQWRAS